MPTPFPGMDPYLERHQRWNAVHTRLIVAIADELGPRVRPRYRVDIELRTYIALLTSDSPAGVPDVLIMSKPEIAVAPGVTTATNGVMAQTVELPMPEEVRERYLVVREVATEEVVTVIEVLSLANKLLSEGRSAYLEKRLNVLGSKTNLVEIDLLRAGEPLSPFETGESHYRILVSAFQERPQARAYQFGIRDAIPDIPIPLRPGEPETLLPLNRLLHELYDRGGYDLAIDYTENPMPTLTAEEMAWVRQLVGGV